MIPRLMVKLRWRVGLLMLSLLALTAVIPIVALADPGPALDPASVDQTLDPGASVDIAKTVHTPPFPPNPEICFLADTTGSMVASIADVAANVGDIMTTVAAAQPSAKFCAAEYKDILDPFRYRLNQAVTSNQTAVNDAINFQWVGSGGDDAPEAQLPALNDLATQGATGWSASPTTTRIIAWFGDSWGHDPRAGVDLAGAIAALTVPTNVTVIPVPVSTILGIGLDNPFGDSGVAQATAIANATGGSVNPAASAAQVSAAILTGLSNLPVDVSMTSDCAAVTGGVVTTVFSAAQIDVPSGTDAVFTETISVAANAAAGTYECDDWALLNGIAMTDAGGATIKEHKIIRVDTDIEKLDLTVTGPVEGPVSEQNNYNVTQTLRNNGPAASATVLDIKEVDCPHLPSTTECSVLIDASVFEMGAKAGVETFRKAACLPPLIPLALGAFQDTPANLGLAIGDCFVVRSLPGTIKELDLKKIINLPDIGGPVVDVTTFDVHCLGPSTHELDIMDTITPWPPGSYTDLNPDNNTQSATYTIDCIAQADMAVVSWDFDLPAPPTGPPADVVPDLDLELEISVPFVFTTTKVVQNFGDTVNDPPQYAGAEDANLWKTMEIPAGIEGSIEITQPFLDSIDGEPDVQIDGVSQAAPGGTWDAGEGVEVEGPAKLSVHFMLLALAVNVPRSITEDFNIHCLEGSFHEIDFTNEIMAKEEHLEDVNPDNNIAEKTVKVACFTPVDIDIHPASDPNSINPKSGGLVPVAILGSATFNVADLDAADIASMWFGQCGDEGSQPKHDLLDGGIRAGHTEDIAGPGQGENLVPDGFDDLVVHFPQKDTNIEDGDTEACILSLGDQHIRGMDSIRISTGGGEKK